MNHLWRQCALCASALLFVSCLAAAPRPAHLDLDLTLEPQSGDFRATAEWLAASDSRVMLHHSLSIRAVTADGIPTGASVERRAGDINEWRVDANAGAMLRIEYGGALPRLDPALDHRRVLGDMPPMAAPQGSFLHAGAAWYPRPAQTFSYRVRLTLPGDQRGLVPGRLVAEEVPREREGRYVATFEFLHPANGIDLMAGPYVVRERLVQRPGAEPLRLRTYFDRAVESLSDGYLEDSHRYIELYSEGIGPYPFTEFSVVASPLPTGFGMPTLTYIGSRVLKLPFIRATSLGHEVLHNWWGNGVYPDYASGNWSEGLTTFMADYFYRERDSDAAAKAMRLAWLRDFAAVPAGADRPLTDFRSRTHGADAAVGYGKAAMVFYMLRDLIGDDAFERGIRSFWSRHRFRVASWEDLRLAFEESSGRALGPFFNQWIGRAGAPRLSIVSVQANTREGGVHVEIVFRQDGPAYSLGVPVEIVSRNHSELRWVNVERAEETVTLPVARLPDGVRLDPELRLWRTLEREQLPPILRQWIIARAPRLAVVSTDPRVVGAAEALARNFFEAAASRISADQTLHGSEPVLMVGLHDDVDAALIRLGLAPRPASLAGRGSATVWTLHRDDGVALAGAPVAVVSARDVTALTAMLRTLPHHGAQSYLVFDGGRAMERGVWPTSGRLIPVRVPAARPGQTSG